jgi:Polyketide cyclase / dehydrase and lipid transport
MAAVRFDVRYHFDAPPRLVWDELVDWAGHGAWIPLTRVDVDLGDPTAAGTTFTAWTGFGRLALEDRMRVAACVWDDDVGRGSCEVDKLGPILRGRAGFTVEHDMSGAGTVLNWFEDVTVPRVPQFLAPVLAGLGASGFRHGMHRLAGLLARRTRQR